MDITGERNLTSAALRRFFSDYYRQNPPTLPPRFTRREWGFIAFDRKGMIRHKQFSRMSGLQGFLAGNGVRHAYHSAAYYDRPDAPRMVEKGWRGADLIFDLDADHLEGSHGISYEDSLAMVKKEFSKLIFDFMISDFGIDVDDLTIVFSGGRGYHLHVHSPGVEKLGSPGRREIVDYITGRGVEFDRFLQTEAFDSVKVSDSHSVAKRKYKMPSRDAGGWQGKMAAGVIKEAQGLENVERERGREGFMEELAGKCKGIGPKKAEKVWNDLFTGTRGARSIDRLIGRGEIDVFSTDGNRNIFLKYVKERLIVDLAGETDEPVTTDTHRLIRLAGSLHGKTGFRAMALTLDEFEDFEPLRDALAFDETPVEVRAMGTTAGPGNRDSSVRSAAPSVTLAGEEYELEEERISELPMFAAVYFMCRGVADFVKMNK